MSSLDDFISSLSPPREDDTVIDRFLNPSPQLSWDLLQLLQTQPREEDSSVHYKSLLQLPEPLTRTQYHFSRRGFSGNIYKCDEKVKLDEVIGGNSSNSLSLSRRFDTESKGVRGSTKNLPFTPGGIVSNAKDDVKMLHRDEDGLFDIAPGMERGIITQAEADAVPDELEEEEVEAEIGSAGELEMDNATESAPNDIDNILPMGIDFARNVHKKQQKVQRNHAHVVDLSHKITNFDELVPNPARTWPFELDTFQKEAVYHLEQGDSVFIAAHTSAGKTVVAEYAIAMSARNMTKTIYTSPIKALSNQKFRDFKEEFDDVGLITGDVQINPDAHCLIMTTEILRSMLYRGADLIRDVEFVIFDEVHYVNDAERGVVWEEVIIMLPEHVKFVLLSATVPNTVEFAEWIGRTKNKDVYVISTYKRPVPLEINIWAKEKVIPVVDKDRNFLTEGFSKHKELLEGKKALPSAAAQRGGRGGAVAGRGGAGAGRGGANNQRGGRGGARGGARGGSNNGNRAAMFKRDGPNKSTWTKLVQYLNSNGLLPAVVFVFSKKRCEEYASSLESVNFCNAREKSQVHMFIEKSISRLKKEDRELPQIQSIRDMLERGIAVHHGGLLPIVKELIEILFAKSLVKVLFATETFAMGLNLPTRTVVFSDLHKHDGTGMRALLPGEFTQMAGRAGRRGLDDIGTVMVMTYNFPLDAVEFKEVTLGVPTRLSSQFRLTYSMILNLLRIEALRVEEMIKYSFSENSNQMMLPEHEEAMKALVGELETLPPVKCSLCKPDIEEANQLLMDYRDACGAFVEEVTSNLLTFKTLRIGRLLIYRDAKDAVKLGFLYRASHRSATWALLTFTEESDDDVCHMPFISLWPEFTKNNFKRLKKATFAFEEVRIDQIETITKYVLKTRIDDIVKQVPEAIADAQEEVNIVLQMQFKLKEHDFQRSKTVRMTDLLAKRHQLLSKIMSLDSIRCPKFHEHVKPVFRKYQIESEISDIKHKMSDQNLDLLPDYDKRLKVLKELGFIDNQSNVVLKGRVACEVNSGYELVITELILDNFLGDFEPEEVVALLSAFVYEGRTREEEPPILTPRLLKGKERIQDIYLRTAEVYQHYQIPLTQEEAEFLDMKRFALVNVVYEWARGMSFKDIMALSVEAEGTIVRVITRLDEICREVKTAALIIGDSALHVKMTQAQELIKRDIVFAASLYL